MQYQADQPADNLSGDSEDKILIEVNYFAEGCLDSKQILAKMNVYARWEDNWYVWEHATENGNLEAPYGRIYISEL